AYATMTPQERPETWPVRSREFRAWLVGRFHQGAGQAPRAASLNDALTVVEALALRDRPEAPVFLRKAEHAGTLYLDLGDERGEVVKIAPGGWEVCRGAPVRFRRGEGMLPLPVPVAGGRVEALRPFVNVAREGEFHLLVAWLLAVLGPSRPYPLLGL